MKLKLKIKKTKQQTYIPPMPKALKSMDYNYSIPAYFIPVEYEEQRPKLLQCAYCDVGSTYINESYNTVLTCTKKDTKDTSDIRAWEISFTGRTLNGDCIVYTTRGTSPVIDAAQDIKDAILEKHYIKNKQEMLIMEQGQKKVVTKKSVATKERVSKQMDPKTGCRPGTIAHDVGTIMLKIGTAPEKRGKCIEKITAFLLDSGTEEKKAKALAASWYSTLKLRKAHIYGDGKKAVAVVKETKSIKLKLKK